jgi:hypothetical protein
MQIESIITDVLSFVIFSMLGGLLQAEAWVWYDIIITLIKQNLFYIPFLYKQYSMLEGKFQL